MLVGDKGSKEAKCLVVPHALISEGTKLTVPAKPFTAPMVTVNLAGPPATTEDVMGTRLMVKSGTTGRQRPCSHRRPTKGTFGVIVDEGLYHVSSLPLALRV
jgi:hypothetical protein